MRQSRKCEWDCAKDDPVWSTSIGGGGRQREVPGCVETATFDDACRGWITRDHDFARQLLMNATKVENQDAVDEDEQVCARPGGPYRQRATTEEAATGWYRRDCVSSLCATRS
jgi:hypothetical protein